MPRTSPPQMNSEAKWKAESDFRTLAEAEEIRADKSRISKAKSAGRKIVRDEQKALRVKQRVAKAPGKRSRRSK